MAYNINKYNTSTAQAIIVEDGTINTTLDIKLIGKNYAGYGEAQNENFVWLLENFASRTEPPNAIVGQLWFDSNAQKLKVNYANSKWHTIGFIDVIGANETAQGLQVGDCWWNEVSEQLYCKGSSGDILIGGKAPAVVTQMRSTTVTDKLNQTHEIIEAVVEGSTIFIISYDTEFELKPTVSDINGFVGNNKKIYPGITMRDTEEDLTPSSGFRVWGTVTNSERLGDKLASDYVTSSNAVFSDSSNFSSAGFTIGALPNNILSVYINTNDIPVFKNEDSDTIYFVTTGLSQQGAKIPLSAMTLVGKDILPGDAGVSNIGSDTERFSTVYADTFDGTATNATLADTADTMNAVQADGTTIDTATAAIGAIDTVGNLGGTIAVRTAVDETSGSTTVTAGALHATYFVGIALFSGGADIAEKYLADDTYDVGTVLMIGGEKEVTAAQIGFRALGVISQQPGYLMNHELVDGTAVALKGRVPVKVTGNVKKGDRLIAADNGVAKVLESESDSLVFAIALSNSDNTDVISVIEAVIL